MLARVRARPEQTSARDDEQAPAPRGTGAIDLVLSMESNYPAMDQQGGSLISIVR